MELGSSSGTNDGQTQVYYTALQISYFIEVFIYAFAMIAGFCAVIYITLRYIFSSPIF